VLGTEDLIPGPGVARFDYALEGAYVRFADIAVAGHKGFVSPSLSKSRTQLGISCQRAPLNCYAPYIGNPCPRDKPGIQNWTSVPAAVDYSEREREAVTGSAYGELYRRRHAGRTPRRVMVHKTTEFKQDEVDGQTYTR
jgi:hypothetical protein